jgi:hypothetical protein
MASTDRSSASSIAFALVVLMLLASFPLSHPSPAQASAQGVPLRPGSLGPSSGQAGAASQVSSTSNPVYDEQMGTTFTQSFGSLTYNVTALAQTDVDGYGPAYILQGLTTAGYWYQVGISYHWPDTSGGYDPGFGFSYEVYGPNGNSVYPSGGQGAGLGSFSKTVDSGDSVLLSLTFSGSTVQMLAQDWNTGATARASYSSVGSSSFVGDTSGPSNGRGYFTGLMTEWYHVSAYTANIEEVNYTNTAVALTSAWAWIDEFDTSSSGGLLFDNQTQTPVVFASDQQLYPFASNGATMYLSAHQFITGMLNKTTTPPPTPVVSSTVTLTPAFSGESSPGFNIAYTRNGVPHATVLPTCTSLACPVGGYPGTSVTAVEADQGTNITVSIDPSTSSLVNHVFYGTSGTLVSFPAGQNATYVYYVIEEQTVSFQVVGAGTAPSASASPELTYVEPPATASGTPSPVVATQVLGVAPVAIFALYNSTASVNGTVPGATGERWVTTTQTWTVLAPNLISNPIEYYHQYEVFVGDSIAGGGTPPVIPEFISTSFGNQLVIPLSGTPKFDWLDAGSSGVFTESINGTTSGERWTLSYENPSYSNPGGLPSGPEGGFVETISSPNEVFSATYTHQYYANLNVNDVAGGSLSQNSGWLDAGGSLNLTASASPKWQFESWVGSGAAAYNGTEPSINITVAGPFTENATFYVQLAIAADPGTNIAYSYGSESGTVGAGNATALYVPPGSNVTLRATPFSFLYNFDSWLGTGLDNSTRPEASLVVDSPSMVTTLASFNYAVVAVLVLVPAVVVVAVAAFLLNRRKKARLAGFRPM